MKTGQEIIPATPTNLRPPLTTSLKPGECKEYKAMTIREHMNWVMIVETTFRSRSAYFPDEQAKADWILPAMSDKLLTKWDGWFPEAGTRRPTWSRIKEHLLEVLVPEHRRLLQVADEWNELQQTDEINPEDLHAEMLALETQIQKKIVSLILEEL
jgi:hypothetical protein